LLSASETVTSDEFASTDLSAGVKPTYEITSVTSPLGALIENEPSFEVAVAVVLPFTFTVAPNTGLLSCSEITLPLMVLVWALTMKPINRRGTKNSR
jgi:hypothetical protein